MCVLPYMYLGLLCDLLDADALRTLVQTFADESV